MIVRDEAPVIRRCLDSVRCVIDRWVIVDTGSADGTQDIIREHLREVPGELAERPWISFAHNRTEALGLALGRGDYVLVIDADETLELDGPLPSLDADSYTADLHHGSYIYLRRMLLRSALPWRYEGVVHEAAVCEAARSEGHLTGVRTIHHKDGARARDPRTYDRDAAALEQALRVDPDNPRTVFYLAQSYRDAGNFRQALDWYNRRIAMGGWRDEVWFSLYQIARIRQRLGGSAAEVERAYLAAVEFDPQRAEPLYALGAMYQATAEYARALSFFARAARIGRPPGDRLFIDTPVYDYKAAVDLAVAYHRVGDFDRAIDVSNRLLRRNELPADIVQRVLTNRRFSLAARFPCPPAARRDQPVRVVVIQSRAGSEVDTCLDSLMRQRIEPFEIALVRNGGFADPETDAFISKHERIRLVSNDRSFDFETCLARVVEEHCLAEEIVIALRAYDRLPHPETLSRWCAAFDDPNCDLAYGQFLWPSGRLGDAEPACDQADFDLRGAALAAHSPVAFRARLLRDGSFEAGVMRRLFEAAGFARARFVDEVTTFLDESASPAPTKLELPSAAPGDERPLISCLMVTRDRLALAKRAIDCFARQSYPAKELVIVTDDSPAYRNALQRHVRDRGLGDSVRFHQVAGEAHCLGQLRNVSLDQARGEIVCQWDDDDCYHPDRLTLQSEHMLREHARACLLTDHLQYLDEERALTWIDWTLGGRTARDQLLPGTVMLFKDSGCRYPESGDYCRQGEDTFFLDRLCDTVPVAPLIGRGHLYLYTYHGQNTFSKQHHHRLRLFSLSSGELRKRANVIQRAVAHYRVPKPLRVLGCDGPAFCLHGGEADGWSLRSGALL
ncbi:MAG TPA: glycosyltransferase [Steroidobacter sp.]